MNKQEAENKLNEHKHLICKIFSHNNSPAKMKMTFLSVDKETGTPYYKVNCFADGSFGHIIEDLDNFLKNFTLDFSVN